MSTIRRHGVAFHLVPSPGEGLWLEVIRESDGAVLVSEEFHGCDDDLGPVVDEWFDDIVAARISGVEIELCRSCGNRRRPVHVTGHSGVMPEFLVEWEFDLCRPCATHLEAGNPWVRGFLEDRYHQSSDEGDW